VGHPSIPFRHGYDTDCGAYWERIVITQALKARLMGHDWNRALDTKPTASGGSAEEILHFPQQAT
jgi:hypothetical protein